MILALSGCFSFSPTATAHPYETARLTLTQTRPAADGTDEAIRVEGVVVSSSLGELPASQSSILLEQQHKDIVSRLRDVVTVDTVQVLGLDIRELEVRRFSWIKSGLATLVVGALAYTLASSFETSYDVSR